MTSLRNITTTSGFLSLASASFEYNNDSSNHNNASNADDAIVLDKALLERYGTRLQSIKAALAESAARVVHDPEEFRAVQRRLRFAATAAASSKSSSSSSSPQQSQPLLLTSTTDAWIKHNMADVITKHAKSLEARKAAEAEWRNPTGMPATPSSHNGTVTNKSTPPPSSSSPTSVLHFLSPDTAAAAKQSVTVSAGLLEWMNEEIIPLSWKVCRVRLPTQQQQHTTWLSS